MTRDEYFDRLRLAAKKLGRYFKFGEVEWDNTELVYYNGNGYYPTKYILSFDRRMNAIHTCELHDLKADSVVIVKLKDITTKNEREVRNEIM